MKRDHLQPYLLIIAAIALLFALSNATAEKTRGMMASACSPLWSQLNRVKSLIKSPFAIGTPNQSASKPANDEQWQRLTLENEWLRGDLEHLRELLQHNRTNDPALTSQLQALPARVIYRSPISWNNILWINVGESDNKRAGTTVIAKNSPVVTGASVVGIIDYVGKNQSRVRLITDPRLIPSVRAARGEPQNKALFHHLEAVVEALSTREDLKDAAHLITELEELKTKLLAPAQALHLAKGELRGSSQTLWRKQSQELLGVGFNYDYADEEGPARDLRSGKTQNTSENLTPLSILNLNDLLVTTGMDGVFPRGLHVAQVTQIDLLKEGGIAYQLRARPTACNLDDLTIVFILPPLRAEEEFWK